MLHPIFDFSMEKIIIKLYKNLASAELPGQRENHPRASIS